MFIVLLVPLSMLEYSSNVFSAFIRFLGPRVMTTALLGFAAKQKVKTKVLYGTVKVATETPECNFSTLQQKMALAAN